MYREKRYAQFRKRDAGDGPGHEGKVGSDPYASAPYFHGRTSESQSFYQEKGRHLSSAVLPIGT